MSKDEEETSQTTRPRRASFAELFANRPILEGSSAQPNAPRTASMAATVGQQAQQHSRRLSITTLGLSGVSPPQATATPFGSLKRGSIAGMARRSSMDENAIDDEESTSLPSAKESASGSTASSGVGRRMSFGARAAYRDMKASGTGENAVISPSAKTPPGAKAKDGFNWSDKLRSSAKRTSISAANPPTPLSAAQNRARSISTTSAQAPVSLPPPKPVSKVPDAFQERILKGDFYMD